MRANIPNGDAPFKKFNDNDDGKSANGICKWTASTQINPCFATEVALALYTD